MVKPKPVDWGIDKLVTALYLAQSNSRDQMLAELICNVLFSANESLRVEDIISYIKDNFHLEPITYEVNNAIEALVERKNLILAHPYYSLSDDTKRKIHTSTIRNKEESDRRFFQFQKLVIELYPSQLDEEELHLLWNVFNEYLLECFMLFGKKAINIFLPYQDMTVSEDADIHKEACSKLTEKLIKIFKQLITEYPTKLSSTELRYLTTLANRAEKFYSLGVQKEDYEKIKDLKVRDLVIVFDTNVLYSVLNLRYHSENPAIDELIKLSASKIIDLRLVYIGRTFSELHKAKQYLERIIPETAYRPAHIKALLASGDLDAFAQQYYQTKLQLPDTPHPGNRIAYGMDLLKSRGVNLYNHQFPKIDNSDQTYLNSRIEEYYNFQKVYKFHKIDQNIEHDVYLREAITELKEKYSNENELKFVCVTLDYSLIKFDQYLLKRGLKKSTVVNPNFILPSVFLRRIRPFIPMVTDDYRKAFLTSLTTPIYETVSNNNTSVVHKSMSFFKNLGIEDESIIMNCIKKDLFLKEVNDSKTDAEAQNFILSEVGREIEVLRQESEDGAKKANYILEQKRLEIERIKNARESENESSQQVVSNLKNEIDVRNESIVNLESRIHLLENYQTLQSHQLRQAEIAKEFAIALSNWEIKKGEFIEEDVKTCISNFRKAALYATGALLLMWLPLIMAAIFTVYKDRIIGFAYSHGYRIEPIWVYLILAAIQLIELFCRTYIINKERVKTGLSWINSIFQPSKSKELLYMAHSEANAKFECINPKPVEIMPHKI